MKAVLDTNVLISGVISTGVAHDVVVAGFRGEYQFIVSEATVTEFGDTLRKYPEKFNMSEQEIQTEVTTVQMFAEFVDPDVNLTVVEEDPDDDKFLEAAVAGDADYLVSGDSHLLNLDSFRDIRIIDPRTFSEILASQ
jgi:putative PIN family toxin of toxin-antitoxin system